MCELFDKDRYRFDVYGGKLLCLFLILNATNLVVKQSFRSATFLYNNITLILGLVYFTYFIIHIRIYKPALKGIVVFETLFLLLLFISLIRYPDSRSEIIKRCVWTIAFCIPLFCIGNKITDHELFLAQVKNGCYFVLLIATYQFVRHMRISDAWFDYDTNLAYLLAFPVIFHLSHAHKRKGYYILAAIELIIILLYGSRGPLLCIGSYVIIRLLLAKQRTLGRNVIRYCAIFFVFVFLIGHNFILNGLVNLFQNMGIQSRTISLLARSKITYGSERDIVWNMVIEKIKEKPLIGWGVAGDQSFMVSYPHQLFLELILHYGMIVGGILGVCIIYKIVREMLKTRFSDRAMIALFCTGFIPLMLSDTYLDNVYFWLLLSFCTSRFVRIIVGGSSEKSIGIVS